MRSSIAGCQKFKVIQLLRVPPTAPTFSRVSLRASCDRRRSVLLASGLSPCGYCWARSRRAGA
jgi:hypothetical protein